MEKLVAQAKEIKRMHAAQRNLLSNFSHELRTPLNAILGFTDLILAEVDGSIGHEKYREYLLHIKAGGERLLRVLSALLDLARLEMRDATASFRCVNLSPLLQEAVQAMSAKARQNFIEIICDVPNETITLHGDELQLRGALVNILSNALNFTGTGGSVLVRLTRRAQDVAIIDIVDRGVGMSEAELERAFEIFGRGDSSEASADDRIGIGLPVSKRIIELHGGKLTLHSEKGVGTVACVSLPCHMRKLKLA